MPNASIMKAVARAWSSERHSGKLILDLSCGDGGTADMLSELGCRVVATDYDVPTPKSHEISCVGGVNLNSCLPFRSAIFDGVDLVEVIEHIENQPQLIREIGRVLKPGGIVLISTPNVLNFMSRIRFLFTGFVRGRVRPVHYSHPPGQAPNIYLIHFYELYYLFFHYHFDIVGLYSTRVKFASRLFRGLCWPLLWLCSWIAVIHAEKDPQQRRYNRQILKHLFDPAVQLSDNLVVKAQKSAQE